MRQVIIYPDTQDGGYIAEIPSLPGCVTQGDTRDQALAHAREAMELWLASAATLHMPIPQDNHAVEICEV